ncbi:MAG: DUF2461 domain-containing protein [Bacteroidota bacterium]
MSITVEPTTLEFLRDLAQHNNRDWFQEHKHRYEQAQKNMIEVAERLHDRLSETDHLVPMSGKKMLFRIYRDVRFSKNKAPYKTHLSGSMKRATHALRGGYYFHVQPGESFVGGGFWNPNKEDLLLIREDIAYDDKPLRRVIARESFQKYFGQLGGDKVKTAPKGFSRDHPAIDLIRHKQYLISRNFTDEEVMAEGFIEEMALTFEAMRPFFDYMSDVLTLDGNGEMV